MTAKHQRRPDPRFDQLDAWAAATIPIGCVDLVIDLVDAYELTQVDAGTGHNGSAFAATPCELGELVLRAHSEDDVDRLAVLRLGGNGF